MILMDSLDQRIADIKARVKIADVMEAYGIKLKRSGSGFLACCPFHNDRSPSMSVSNELYCCYGCDAGGDVIRFVEDMKVCSSAEAAEAIEMASFGICRPMRNEGKEKERPAKPPVRDEEFQKIVADGLERLPHVIDAIASRFRWKASTARQLCADKALGATPHNQALWVWPGTYQRENQPGRTPKRLSARGRRFKGLYRSEALSDQHEAILIGEGAKDVAACVDAGLDSHPSVHAVGLVSKSVRKDSLQFFEPLAGRRAVLLLDRDADFPTLHKLAMRLRGVGCSSVRFLDWEKVPSTGLGKGADIDDLRITHGGAALKEQLPSWLISI